MKIVFMGTPDFAVPSLKALINEFEVEAVFTQPDRRKGRGKKLGMSPVKEIAIQHNIKVFQPENLKKDNECIEELRNINPDFIIVVAYGQILSKEILDIPKYGCINLHASILPRYRGAAPINWAIIKGEKESGNTTMLMDEGLDTGDMLLKSVYEIKEEMTYGELHDMIMEDGGDLLIKTIKGLLEGTITREKQKDGDSCYAPMLSKETGRINWNLDNRSINNLIRGLSPWPLAFTTYNDEIMKIYKCKLIDEKCDNEAGYIMEVSNQGIKVATGEGALLIQKIQFPSKKPMLVEEYIRGNEIQKGTILK
ncbi:methionyl-tRNA formyltransferase [Clostridium sp. MSJ-11]|uniref:Methionyl-tRNA formyltransferase n=1 Tax=Clostridium mobile TaxID=2841512 RepID=A0ABS6EDB9_9CLOT|nr:methionyl-tRNA formyltransferase [Clostridium mobile]MBU5482726.1 methionyl-tRNA formyltransferase [Clostridium mobile]